MSEPSEAVSSSRRSPAQHAAYRAGEAAYALNIGDWAEDPFVAVRAAVDAVWPLAVAEGRRQAAEAIVAHRDQFWPNDDRLNTARARVRRHLDIAIRVADPITPEQAAEAVNRWVAGQFPKGADDA
jgi:hypothetical protein